MTSKPLKATSKDLVSTGPKHISPVGTSEGRRGHVRRPTSSRALVLRNGKHGAMGTGELVLSRKKLSGREKLDLLAEDLVQRAVLAPFRIEQCLSIASSQFHAYLDDIANLKDSALFCDLIMAELEARSPVDQQQRAESFRNPSQMANTVATRIHNAYMLAAGWKFVFDTLMDLAANGLTDDNVKTKLKNNPQFRLRYLILYDMIGELVDLNQAHFSSLAMTAPHYARYFKKVDDAAPDEPDVRFDWNGLREACLSFIDSIIMELCFPRAPYPRDTLFSILHDAVVEAPKDAKRFPQALWDAVGDFSASIQLHSLIEAALLGPENNKWKQMPRSMPEEYDQWRDAYIYSTKASNLYASFKDIIYPPDKAKNQLVLNEMWKRINLNYKSVSGRDIDSLWGLSDSFNVAPQWHAFYLPILGDLDGDVAKKKKQKRTSIAENRMAAVESDSDDSTPSSMPSLQTVSGSSESESEDDSDDSESKDPSEYADDESGYDTEEEEELRDLLRAALDVAHETDFYDSANLNPDLDPLAQKDNHSDNPFIKLLGSLRGRLFSSDPKLKVGESAKSRGPKFTVGKGAPRTTPEEIEEDVEGGNDMSPVPKKQKKKKKPKKKPTAVSLDKVSASSSPISVVVEPSKIIPPAELKSPRGQQQPPSTQRKVMPKPAPTQISNASFASLPVEPTVAQSARSYIKAEQLDILKSKTKTRSDQASIFSDDVKNEKKSMWAKLRLGKNTKNMPEEEQKEAKQSWFQKLSKRATNCMHQLLRTPDDEKKGLAPMKWDHFVALMSEMGFEVHPETAGSSVRFNPPDKRDRPISIHKPHPDSTLEPKMLKEIASRLKRYYGWNKEDFLAKIH